MNKYILFLLVCLSFLNLQAQESSVSDFKNGVNSFKQKNLEEAKKHFLNVKPQTDISTLYNLGLIELELGRPGVASAFWKKVLDIKPFHSQAKKSLKSISKRFARSSNNTNWEKFRTLLLNKFTIFQILFFFTLFFTGAMATAIKYLTRRHIALKSHFPLPPLPMVSVFFMVLFILSSVLFAAKAYDYFKPRATVIADLSPLFLSPSEEDIKISELDQGHEVIITKIREQWAQVETLSGNKGWVQKQNLYQTSGDPSL